MAVSSSAGRRKLKNSSKARIAVVGGSGLEAVFRQGGTLRVGTPYGVPSPISTGEIDGRRIIFVNRHGTGHTIPPHRINYRANISALYHLGVHRIIATNAVGAINQRFKPGDFVIPNDFLDFTKSRKATFYDRPVIHIDMSEPYCPEIRSTLDKAAENTGKTRWNTAVLAVTEGPRYETPTEIKMLRNLGCDVVGMTGIPEAVLSRELGMCYASLAYVSNMAAGLQKRQSATDLTEMSEKTLPRIKQVLKEAILSIPETRSCMCAHALKDAKL